MRFGIGKATRLVLVGAAAAVALMAFVASGGALTNTTVTLVDAKNHSEVVAGNPQAVPPGAVVDLAVTTTLGSGSDNFRSVRWRVDSGTWTCDNDPDATSNGSTTTHYVNNVTLPEATGAHSVSVELFPNDGCNGTPNGTASRSFTTKTPTANQDLTKKCDLQVALVLDESGSIANAGATQSVRNAAKAFADGLVGSGAQIGVVEFNTSARVVDLDPSGSAFYNGVTQSWVDNQLTPYLTNDYNPENWTNWQDALKKVLDQANPDLVVFITDGDPTARNPAPDTNFPDGSYSALDPAFANANQVRADGSHIFVIGVGNGLSSGSSQVRLRAISGPDQYPAVSDIFKADYTLVTDFDDLQGALADLARSLCSVRVKVQKLVDSTGDGQAFVAENGWTFDGTVTVSGPSNASYRWLAPGAVTGPPSGGNTRTATTATTVDGTGYADFSWLPSPTNLTSQIVLQDNGKPGFHYARVSCTKNGQPLTVTAGQTITISGLIKQDLVVCTFENQKDAGRIKVVKQFTGTPVSVGLQVDGETKTTQAAASFDTGWVPVSAGQHTVGEAFTDAGDAALFVTTYQCGTEPEAAWSGQPVQVDLTSGQDRTCTFFNKRKPRLTVLKSVVGGSGETFDLFVGSEKVADDIGDGGSGSKVLSGPATVPVSETFANGTAVGSGWAVSYSGACNGTPSVTLGWGDDKTCTITNSRDKGRLTVKKVILSSPNETARFDLAVNGVPVPGLNDVGYPGGEATVELPTGSHTVSETFDGGGSVTASGDWLVQWSDNCPNGVATVTAGADPVVCTVTNKRRPTLTVTKNVVGSSQQFDVFVDQQKLFTSSGASTSQTKAFDAAGVHAVSETLDGGGPVGSDWDVDWAGDCAAGGHHVTLSWGDAKSCTITNTRRPKLTVTKVIVGTGAGASFDVFDGVGQSPVLAAASLATQSVTKSYPAGTAVDVTETMTGGGAVDANAWDVAQSGDCKVTLAAGNDRSCTITNKRRPTVLVKKVVVGGTKQPADFTIGITAASPDRQSVTGSAAGVVVTADPGAFAAVESNPSPLYDVSYSDGCEATLSYGDAQRTCTVTNTRKPFGITVTKTARQTSLPEPGGTVTFDVAVKNDSVADTVSLTTLTDDPDGPGGAPPTSLDGVGTCDVPQVLAPGATYACSFELAISGNGGESKTDVVAAAGTNEEGSPVSDDDDATVSLTDVLPSISVVKTADPVSLPEPGGDVSFRVVVTNTSVSSDPVTIASLTDDVYGDLSGKGSCPVVPVTLQKGEKIDCSFTGAVAGNAGSSHTDVVTASGHDDEQNPVSGHDDATVTLTDVDSTLEVTKTASPSSRPEPGGDFTFTVTVENTSATDTVTIDSLVDVVAGGEPRNLDGDGTCDVTPGVVLAPGTSYTCTFTTTFTSSGPDSQSDVVTASGHDDDGDPVSDSAGATVRITDVPSSIQVTKTPSVGSVQEPGRDVEFTVVVRNTSATDTVSIGSLTDSVFGDLDGKGSCDVTPGVVLAPGTSYECRFTGPVTGTGGTQHENTVTAGGQDDDGHPVSGEATATVEITKTPPQPPQPPVVEPAPVIDLAVTKAATTPTKLNGIVTYTIVVTNNGPGTATNVTLADPAPTGIAYESATPAAPTCQVIAALVQCSLGSLAAGQSVTVRVIGRSKGVTGTIRNTVTVTGGGGDEPNTANNTASASTLVVAPVTPPTAKPKPKPKPKPRPICRSLAAGPKMLKGNGKAQKIRLKVYAAGKGVPGVRVRIVGPGVARLVTTGKRGVVVLTVKPAKAGILRASIVNAKACNTQRIGVVGISTFEPPVTG